MGSPLRRMLTPEVIGDPECPILHRWTLFGERRPVKVMVHHFMPNADDRDTHDHPRPFWTMVLRGGYDDTVPCLECKGVGIVDGGQEYGPLHALAGVVSVPCSTCSGSGLVAGDRMRPGMLRRRAATYAHRTRVLPAGCWTVVMMGPVRRPWGFIRWGRWIAWRDYGRMFGFGMRCGEEGDDGR